jgi:hypothetical protein
LHVGDGVADLFDRCFKLAGETPNFFYQPALSWLPRFFGSSLLASSFVRRIIVASPYVV